MFPTPDFNANCWQTQEAKAHFSEVVKRAVHDGDQFITYHGEQVAVVMSKSRYESLLTPTKSIVDFFQASPCADIDLETTRTSDLSREIDL